MTRYREENLIAIFSRTDGAASLEADPRPYKLQLQGPGELDAALGILYQAGDFETLAGAELEANLAGRPAVITHSPYRFKATVPPYRARTIDPKVAAEIKAIAATLNAQERAKWI